MTLFERILFLSFLLGVAVFAFFLLDALLARPVYVTTRLVEPDATDYIGHHTSMWIGGRS